MRRWTIEQRMERAISIHGWMPWTHSTGPRTIEGKRRVARNALRHGMRTAESVAECKKVNAVILESRDFVLGCMQDAGESQPSGAGTQQEAQQIDRAEVERWCAALRLDDLPEPKI